jgi:hypothetical protein
MPSQDNPLCAGVTSEAETVRSSETIWEDAVDRGYVTRESVAGSGGRVKVTENGKKFLRKHGR